MGWVENLKKSIEREHLLIEYKQDGKIKKYKIYKENDGSYIYKGIIFIDKKELIDVLKSEKAL